MSDNIKAILALIEKHPEDNLPLCRALWAVLSEAQKQIIEVIAQHDSPITVSDVVAAVKLSQPIVSKQLTKLRNHGLLTRTKHKKQVFYAIAAKHTAFKKVVNGDRIS